MFPCAAFRQTRQIHTLNRLTQISFMSRFFASRLRASTDYHRHQLVKNVQLATTSKAYAFRSMHSSSCLRNGSSSIRVTFVTSDGERHETSGKEGDTLLDVVVDKNIPLDGYGACEGTLACSTCHVILKQEDFDRLPNKPVDEELDMLDLAVDLSDTSRLGCQITLTKDLDGLEVTVPSGTRDVRAL